MTYTDDDHRRALTLLDTAQLARVDAGLDALTSDRALESMAPENTGNRSERVATILARARLAETAHRQARRLAALADSKVRDPVDLEAAVTGRRRPSRAARRAAARQARATRKRTDR